MRQVQFSQGPYIDQYEDGHPPEKATEEERRRYRCGLTMRGNLHVDASSLEEAFQSWLKKQKENNTTVDNDYEISPSVSAIATSLGPDQKFQKLEDKLLDLSPFASKAIVINIQSDFNSPTQLDPEEVDPCTEVPVSPSCRSVPLLVKQLICGVLLLAPFLVFVHW